MTPKQFVHAVELALMPLADEAKAQGMKAYLLNQFEFLGLAAPVRRAAVKEIGKVKWQSSADFLAAAELLWQKPEREYRYTAVDLLRQHSAQLSVNELPALQALLLQDAWWETVDGLSAVIAEVMHATVEPATRDGLFGGAPRTLVRPDGARSCQTLDLAVIHWRDNQPYANRRKTTF
jgi:3-methyladenine DNA glycosylase AlkD